MSKNYHVSLSKENGGRGRSIRQYLSRVFLALCIMGVGIGYLGNYIPFLPWEHFTLFFPGWGSLFLIVPAIYMLIRWPFSWFWPVCLLVGVLILLSKLEVYPFGTCVAIVLAVLVILIGLRILFNPLFRRWRTRRIRKHWSNSFEQDGNTVYGGNGVNDFSVSFGSRNVDLDDENFTSATLGVSFGEMHFDLRRAGIQNCAVIDARCSFGELEIRLPEHVRVEVRSGVSFASVNNKHGEVNDPTAPVVYINADCAFGEISIR